MMRLMLAVVLIMLAGEAYAQRGGARPAPPVRPAASAESISPDRRPGDDTRALDRAARRAAAHGFTAEDVLGAYQRDTNGNWLRRGEIVITARDAEPFASAATLGLIEQRRSRLAVAGVEIVTYTVLDVADMNAAVRILRAAHPGAGVDFNYIYAPQGEEAAAAPHPQTSQRQQRTDAATVGIIDGPIATADARFAGVRFTTRRFARGELTAPAHGGAVAEILARTLGAEDLRIVAADVVSAGPIEAAAIDELAAALDWAAGEGVGVINVSLTGPPSQTLAIVVRAVSARGAIVVAPAGNSGPRAAPPFPAALPQVVGVTAVDARDRIWRRATRGDHVDFAALGVRVEAGDGVRVTGTSYAAPLVSGLLARVLPAPDAARAAAAQAEFAARARDLGPPGRDPAYGHGVIDPL